MKYPQEARSLWRTSVPHSGQAATVQGELLRAVEKLRDEAQRNGNINWDGGYETLIAYLRDNLLGSTLFDQTAAEEMESDLDRPPLVANAAKAYARRRALISDEVGVDYRAPCCWWRSASSMPPMSAERGRRPAAGARVADLAYARSAG